MAGDWRETTWGEEVSLEYGKALRGHDTSHGRFRVYGSNGPIGWTTVPLASGPGVILGRKGAYRGVEYSRDPFFVIDTAYYVVPKTQLDMRWLYYAIKHHKLGEIDDGSPIPSTTRAAVYVRELEVPPIAEQRAIAHILGTLDDKIELNRRMNETLEGMARAIFKSWFVDFDPVRAKADGRQPAGMDAATAALFPDSFEDSPLGKIPKGWKAGTFGEVAESPRRTIDPKSCAPETPYIGLEHMPRRNITLADWGLSGNVTSGKAAFSRGEILFGKLRPYFHKVGVALVDGVCSTDILTIVPRRPEFRGFVLYHASSTEIIDYADAVSTGTKMPRVSWNDLTRFEIPIPSRETAGKFTQNVEPMLDRLRTNVLEIRSLAAMRDALLPKLLSGEIRVREAEQLVEVSLSDRNLEAARA